MRKLLFTAILLVVAVSVSAVPAKPGTKRHVTLADGTTVALTLHVDEHFSYYTDAQDQPCLLKDGQLKMLTQKEVGEMWTDSKQQRINLANGGDSRRAASRRIGKPKVTKGIQRGLVILLEYTDVKFTTPNPLVAFQRFFNEVDYTEGGMAGSVRDYFLAQSYDQLEIDFDVVGPYCTANEMAYYGKHYTDEKGNEHTDSHPALMVKEAVDAASKDVDFRNYDWDKDGEVDQVFVIYAGYAEAQGADENTIWPHEWNLNSEDAVRKYNGVTINTYACTAELAGDGKTFGGYMDGIGTACHEFSHCLGLPDMYDTKGNNFAMSYWDVMSSGSYNDDSRSPASFTSYERMFASWMEPIELNTMTRINDMAPLEEKPEAYILYNDNNKNEYYLLENRQPIRFDKGLLGHGMLILHVDYNKGSWGNNEVNTVADHQRMTIIPADNKLNYRSYGGDPWPGVTGNTSLTNYTTPAATLYNANVDGQKLMSKPIDNITENTATHTVSFVACRPEMDVPDITSTTVTSVGNSFTIQWPAVQDAIGYEIELTSISKGATTPEEGLQLEVDFSKFYNEKTGTKDISTSLSSYGLGGWSGSKLYTSPGMLKIGTSSTAGYLKSPMWDVPESGSMTIVMGADEVKAGKVVNGVLKISCGNKGESISSGLVLSTDFEVTGTGGKYVFHFEDIRKDLFYLNIEPESQMYLNYLAIYDGIWTEEQLGLANVASSRRANAVVETFTSTANSYTFLNMSTNSRYAYRIRALGEENTVSRWSEEGTFEFGEAGINTVSIDNANVPVFYYDPQGRKVGNNSRGIVIRRQGSDVRKVVLK